MALGNAEESYEWLAQELKRLHVLVSRVAGVTDEP